MCLSSLWACMSTSTMCQWQNVVWCLRLDAHLAVAAACISEPSKITGFPAQADPLYTCLDITLSDELQHHQIVKLYKQKLQL